LDDKISEVIGRLHHTIVDAPNPTTTAAFWSAVLGLPITFQNDDFVVVSANETTSGLGFQRAPALRQSTWPDPDIPQQIHFDVMVDDLRAASSAVKALGARQLPGEHVFADPAGHPFCLIARPPWAAPIEHSG
jgi:catechol 2,3-dioxygenase-like lactoylglutathione lyase family enzyme